MRKEKNYVDTVGLEPRPTTELIPKITCARKR